MATAIQTAAYRRAHRDAGLCQECPAPIGTLSRVRCDLHARKRQAREQQRGPRVRRGSAKAPATAPPAVRATAPVAAVSACPDCRGEFDLCKTHQRLVDIALSRRTTWGAGDSMAGAGARRVRDESRDQ